MHMGLVIAAILSILIGGAHSILGEKYILIRLFRRDNLPVLRGSDWFTKRTLRLAWHVTTIAWWGFAAILFLLARNTGATAPEILRVIALSFIATGAIALIGSNGRHLSWLVFLTIGVLTWLAA